MSAEMFGQKDRDRFSSLKYFMIVIVLLESQKNS